MHRGGDGTPAVKKSANCVLKTWQRAHTHNCVTCRVTLLSNPPPPKGFFFHRGGWQTLMLYIRTLHLHVMAGLKICVFIWVGVKRKGRAIPPFIDPAISLFTPPPTTHTHRVPELSRSSDANDVYTCWVIVFFTVFTVDIPRVLFVFIYD